MLHPNITPGSNHILHNWSYANAAARLAAGGFVAADVNKLALQADNNTLWMLTNHVGPVWQQQTYTQAELQAAYALLAGSSGQVFSVAAATSAAHAVRADSIVGKNKIIGGDFSTNPWQRGTSFTAPASGSYTADRFKVVHSSDAIVDILKTADAPTATQSGVFTQHCYHADVTTADAAIAAGQYYVIEHDIEGLNAKSFGFGQAGTRYITRWFWHKHTKTGTYCVAVINSANNRSYVTEYTQSVSDQWELSSVSIPVDTAGTWLYDTGIGIRLVFTLAAGSTYQTTANTWSAGQFYATANQVNNLDSIANNFKIALVQLEAGQVATQFEDLSAGTVKSLCERYYESSYADGIVAGTGYLFGFIHVSTGMSTTSIPGAVFRTRKRIAPTVTPYQVFSGAANNIYRVGDGATVGVASVDYISPNGFGQLSVTAAAQNGYMYHFTASSEL